MKLRINQTVLLNMGSVLLGLGLSALSVNAFAATEEESTTPSVSSTTSNESEGAMQAPAVIPEIETPVDSGVASATPPMSKMDFNGVSSLRGGAALDGGLDAPEIKLLPSDSLPIARNYFQQPPMIPHRVREYKITVRNNKCMSCHSWNNYKKAKATKVSQTHFEDRDGNAQSTLAARRYFCNQCHVPQVDAKPLVENNFMPVNELNK